MEVLCNLDQVPAAGAIAFAAFPPIEGATGLPASFWLLFAAAMLISSIGFKNYVWFISLRYGFSVAGEVLLMLLLYGKNITLGTIICCVLFIIYGCRLGGYLAYRELKSSSYKKEYDR